MIAFEDGAGNHHYVAKDKVGSIRNVATRSGTWVMRLRHRPYRTLIDSVGTGVMLRYRWTGREWDAELGWYYMRARCYDPAVSRFTQKDPIGFADGNNLYTYVGGSPLEARDSFFLDERILRSTGYEVEGRRIAKRAWLTQMPCIIDALHATRHGDHCSIHREANRASSSANSRLPASAAQLTEQTIE